MSFLKSGVGANIFNPVPIDPITSRIDENLPRGAQTVLNPAGPALKAVVGQKTASELVDPVGLGVLNKEGSQKQTNALLGSSADAPTRSLLG